MSDTILNGDFTIHYFDDNRRKQIVWSGSAGEFYTMNQLYSALQTLFDEVGQMDDGTVMSAETPFEYTIGKIDSGDTEPWYISFQALEHLNGGALRTNGWDRVTGSNTGIIVVPVTSNAIVGTDIGLDIDGATTGHGTLLEVLEAGTTDYLVIRPNSNVAGDDFTTASQTITCNGHTASQSGAVSFDGEMIWANLYSIGTIEPDTHVYMYQGDITTGAGGNRKRVYSLYDATQDWWGDGHIDVCVPIKDHTAAGFPVIDGGYISVFARKYTNLYEFFETTTSLVSGGRNPVPLATQPDLDNITGYKSITTTAVSVDDFSVGDEIQGVTSGARAIITQIDGTTPTYTFHYFLIDDPQTDFQTAAEVIDNNDTTGSATKNGSAPADQGPALASWFTNNTPPTVSFANTTFDVDNDGTAEGYGITIDCNQNTLAEVYEWTKYVTRRGATGTTEGDGDEAEQYVGATTYLEYSGAITGTIAEGDYISQATSGAVGIVVSLDASLKQLLVRNTRGVFTTTYLITGEQAGTFTPNVAAVTFAPKKATPFGNFAGGTFFGARGLLLSDYLSAEENSFQLIDNAGNLRARPVSISITVTNLIGTGESTLTDDRVAIFRLTGAGGGIQKSEFTVYDGTEIIGDATIDVTGAIPVDVPGQSSGGVLRLRDATNSFKEYRLRYSSWNNTGGGGTDGRFVLANIVVTAEGGTDTDTIVDTGMFATAKRGDLVLNTSRANAIAYITSVDDANTIQIYPPIAGQTTGDNIEINAVPVNLGATDEVYVPLLDRYATANSEGVSIVYNAPIYFSARVRNVAHATPIKPFVQNDSVLSNSDSKSVATIRTEDTIYT